MLHSKVKIFSSPFLPPWNRSQSSRNRIKSAITHTYVFKHILILLSSQATTIENLRSETSWEIYVLLIIVRTISVL